MPDLPSHASPYFSPQSPPDGEVEGEISLNSTAAPRSNPAESSEETHYESGQESSTENERGTATPALPGSFLSPAFTPPSTPGGTMNPASVLHQTQLSGLRHRVATTTKAPKLLDQLPSVECIVRARIPTTSGTEMFLHLYHNDIDNKEHLAIVFGNTIRSRSLDRVKPGETELDRMIRGAYVGKLHPGRISSWYDEKAEAAAAAAAASSQTTGEKGTTASAHPTQFAQAPLVRIHSECYTGETAWSARCDCGEQLDEAARLMSLPEEALPENLAHADAETLAANSPGGVIVYLRQEGRGIGLGEKLKAYNLQDLGSDTVEANLLLRHPADARSYGLATAILVDLGLGVDANPEGIRLLTNNPDKIRAVEGANREVVVKDRVSMVPLAWRTGGKKGINSTEVEGYLRTKIAKMGHMIK
ncbi:hypothetical protein ASPZODRAFT_128528 [Penicilliopsis zonata CBS 506.65]|uniref:GTP cyclohydrolase II n=1 Tax=Penicilliopsis zonata CBS 506.65 TaxID=1073090 RepID=A0A1L9SS39_9EURO|nr:hypothetical protein ASPZODRAFT_128528 [Penicilliopsis zonata CBS 506.65]OJJ49943.1 hypothetical protein ASPZODRAFT_128528 [Penicilliopsis zonata CBS 506.65]